MKQSIEDRKARLEDGCCPIHGIAMSQCGPGDDPRAPDPSMVLVDCGRKDCDVTGWQSGYDAPVILEAKHAHLIGVEMAEAQNLLEYRVTLKRTGNVEYGFEWSACVHLPDFRGHCSTGDTPQQALASLAVYWASQT